MLQSKWIIKNVLWFFFYPGVLNWCLCLTWIRNLPSTSGFFEQECTFSFCLSSNCWCCQIGICVFRWAGRKEAQFPYKGDLKKKIGGWWKFSGKYVAFMWKETITIKLSIWTHLMPWKWFLGMIMIEGELEGKKMRMIYSMNFKEPFRKSVSALW